MDLARAMSRNTSIYFIFFSDRQESAPLADATSEVRDVESDMCTSSSWSFVSDPAVNYSADVVKALKGYNQIHIHRHTNYQHQV